MKNWQIIACLLCSVLVVGAGCSSDSNDSDNNNAADVEQLDVGQEDSGKTDADPADVEQQDSGQADADVEPETDADEESDTVEEEVEQPVTIESDGKKFAFTNAVYGLTSPEKSENGVWDVHVELWEGGFTGCLIETSQTPYRQLVFYGLSVGEDDNLVVDDWLALLLMDYRGEVFPAEKDKPVIRPYSHNATGVSWEFCTECLSGEGIEGRKNGELVVKLKADFDTGLLEGTFRA